ncbi:MAG: helix-turn-helix domain-containing protein [Bdellovibrio sp.]
MDISGPFWMLVEVNTKNGFLSWKVDGKMVRPEKNRLFLFLPDYTWTSEFYPKKIECTIRGLFSVGKVQANWPSKPTLFTSNEKLPLKLENIGAFFTKSQIVAEVALQSSPSGTASKVKKMLETKPLQELSMAKIASQLKSSAAVISRSFKKSYGYTPIQYKRGLRVTLGMYHLLNGKDPSEAAYLAGYNDLSRFYKQFKQYIKDTPESHRIKRSKNAKT